MRDKKDNATLDLVGFDLAAPAADGATVAADAGAGPRKRAARSRAALPRQEQLELLDETDATGLPVWRRDEGLDLTGLPVWANA